MRALVVLSHLMSKNCTLSVESIARTDLAIKKNSSETYDLLITIGWAYRCDCITPIADVVRRYIVDHSSIDERLIKSLKKSRDTVGDAYFCLEFFSNLKITKLHVITSDYHVNRANIIFNSIFSDHLPIEVFGVKTEANNDISVLDHEQRSLEAFYKTFKGVDMASKNSIFKALASRHPFYNGEIYTKISDE